MPQPSSQQQVHTWAVTGHEEEPSIDEDGQPTVLHHVSFLTNTGHESSVTLPDKQFSARNVAEQIHFKAGEINKVHNMNSTNAPSADI